MHYNFLHYVQALAQVAADSKSAKENSAKNFLTLLKKKGMARHALKIAELAEDIVLRKRGNKNIVIEKAREVDASKFIKQFAKKGDKVKERVNPSLVAGIKIVINGQEQLDFSLASKLQRMLNIHEQ